MATSTFGKKLIVKPEKADEFVREMTRPVAPTLRKGFQSKLVHEKDLRGNLSKVLK